jgi:hypothetical protein
MPFGPWPFRKYSVVFQCFMQQRRAVRGTVRVEREGAAGDEEPATKSRASSLPTVQEEKIRETVRAERTIGSGVEHGRPSAISREPGTSEEPPVNEGISPKSRGDERTESPEYRVGGKTAPVAARWGRAVAGRQAGGGCGTCRGDTRTEI